MDILTQKRITDNGDGRGYFRNCIEYAFKEKSEENEALIQVKGYGVSGRSPENAYNQMYNVKKYYGKTGDNPVMHFVVSYDNCGSSGGSGQFTLSCSHHNELC